MQHPRFDADSEKIIALMNIVGKLYWINVKCSKCDNCYLRLFKRISLFLGDMLKYLGSLYLQLHLKWFSKIHIYTNKYIHVYIYLYMKKRKQMWQMFTVSGSGYSFMIFTSFLKFWKFSHWNKKVIQYYSNAR